MALAWFEPVALPDRAESSFLAKSAAPAT